MISNNHSQITGTAIAFDCPPGTMLTITGGKSLEDCEPCQAGKYCQGPAATGPTGDCSEGYYCPSAANISSPEPSGYQCLVGHFCPVGTSDAVPCPPGNESNRIEYWLAFQ